MNVEVWLSPSAVAPSERGHAELAVVIDVLRATTVAATALAAGARSITACLSVEEAFKMKAEATGDNPPLLCGERDCNPIDGFDYGNSPSEYSPAGVGDRDLIMTTTNGTRAINEASNCDGMLLASFTNLSAVAQRIVDSMSSDGLLRIVCAGTNGAVTGEDALLAGALLAVCHKKLSDTARFYDGPLNLVNDSAVIALAAWQHCISHDKVTDGETLATRLSLTQGGKNMVAAGYGSDLVDCGSIDVFDVVPTRQSTDPARFTV
ncbi:2-phosphosulfolactate phosphatase [Neorhodopirellula lusitana]|uniref:Probable 2-phosphosulfolactate phosphatase n=1 Tax=Neorhodopirellula lusitana TaxID=445327 RepID=A0ABY1Q6C8_9BACT|nr:2-phosphosulfolactate phosphatase [Neorhodopirellula lusitana]SMP57109.1 2-phosphosulfolactate phosphatase [Neorhodopirellula lusitana]